MSAICLNNIAGARTQEVARSLVFAVLDVPRGVQTLTSRVWLPVDAPTAALGYKP